MKKSKIKSIVNGSIDQRNLCRMYFRYDAYYWYFFPLITSDKLFLGAKEEDFLIDGYSIRRFVDVTKVQIREDKCVEILKTEGISSGIQIPNIDISTWETVFSSLQKTNKNIIVAKENIKSDETEFVIGRIDKVYKKFVYIYHFDADGIWQEEPYRIPYSTITSVSFGTRYVETFSKYLEELPLKSK